MPNKNSLYLTSVGEAGLGKCRMVGSGPNLYNPSLSSTFVGLTSSNAGQINQRWVPLALLRIGSTVGSTDGESVREVP